MAERRAAGRSAVEPGFLQFNDLACESVGGKEQESVESDGLLLFQVIFATDEWFAPAANLLKREQPQFIASAFTEFGKWMDGWETRRKRTPGHDWCLVELGVPGLIYGFDVDTSFFTGNHSPHVSIQASCLDPAPTFTLEGDRTGMAASDSQMAAVAKLGSEAWPELVSVSELKPGFSDCCHNYFKVEYKHRVTHLRLNMYPGTYTHTVDQQGILQVPGWEWAVFRLGHPGVISRIEIDTNHFKGNFPDSCRIEACTLTPEEEAQCIKSRWNFRKWQVLLAPQKLRPHLRHHYSGVELTLNRPVSHVRVIIAPDGGVSRLRIWGRPTKAAPSNQHIAASKL
ncbi:allantoicase isoform X3 [Channa argus]|uniref:allantoicase isoform X3 n=1 Tax=Channa argus TaxID=215402 RepID=UPI00351FC5CB